MGFSPAPELAWARSHLAQLDEPCAISFGRNGHPLYIAGPDDDPVAVINTLHAKLGAGGFAVAA
jgi:hypothetical protein